ncbi:S26 family signal peptidase [Nonomuraea sp. SYSU D8015]|uniref:S26 family signal peptidase n=1 Tax=Nonomuraea sp. SYSU D8015 TaxID=2593644 RepID=UPI001CB6EC7E|nr:S26 family signal peptidase [Nonomuraea sp. SYSU D8015]
MRPAGTRVRVVVAPALLGAAAAAAVAWLRRRYVLVSVYGPSMEPAYRSGDRVWVRRVPVQRVHPGDVVVVRLDYPDDWDRAEKEPWSIKRVTAVPGDPVPPAGVPAWSPEATVPVGHLVVRGDNADHSYDSRHCGYVPGERLLGVVVRGVQR